MSDCVMCILQQLYTTSVLIQPHNAMPTHTKLSPVTGLMTSDAKPAHWQGHFTQRQEAGARKRLLI